MVNNKGGNGETIHSKTNVLLLLFFFRNLKTGPISAYPPDYPVGTTGRTIIELQKNILEALNFYFEEEGNGIQQIGKELAQLRFIHN